MSVRYFSNFQRFELFLLAETIDVPFSFLRGEEDRKEGYKRLVKHSAIWVNATKLTALTSTATSISKYARQLMWDVIISTKDIKKMNTLKGRGVGFVKMFGDENLKDVYGERDTMSSNFWFLNTVYSPVFTKSRSFVAHICKVRESKEKASAPGKWSIQKLKSFKDYKDLWRKYFPQKSKIETKYS